MNCRPAVGSESCGPVIIVFGPFLLLLCARGYNQVGKLSCPALLCSGGPRSGPPCHGRGAARLSVSFHLTWPLEGQIGYTVSRRSAAAPLRGGGEASKQGRSAAM